MPGPILYWIYTILVNNKVIEPLLLFANKKDLSTMIAGFSYTMLGFLATIITILFIFTKTPNFEAYKRNGYLDILFTQYFLTVICLMLTAGMSVYGYSANPNPFPFRVMLMLFADNIIQIVLVTTIICNLARNSQTV